MTLSGVELMREIFEFYVKKSQKVRRSILFLSIYTVKCLRREELLKKSSIKISNFICGIVQKNELFKVKIFYVIQIQRSKSTMKVVKNSNKWYIWKTKT